MTKDLQNIEFRVIIDIIYIEGMLKTSVNKTHNKIVYLRRRKYEYKG